MTGIGLALAASVLLPVVKAVARPMLAAGMQGAVTVGNQVRSGVSYIREEVEDLLAEAQFERMKNQIDRDMIQ